MDTITGEAKAETSLAGNKRERYLQNLSVGPVAMTTTTMFTSAGSKEHPEASKCTPDSGYDTRRGTLPGSGDEGSVGTAAEFLALEAGTEALPSRAAAAAAVDSVGT
jgi:hypothetical protein